ncbi:MAG: FkbM family methyltransferase [Cognatishimia sp.]
MTLHILDGVRLELPEWLQGTAIEEKIVSGSYEGHEAHAARQRIRPGMRVLEIGAGLGFVSTICAQKAGAENVMSVEANPRMLDPLQNNLRLNGQQAATVMHGAVVGDAHADLVVNFRAGTLFWGGSIVAEGQSRKDMVSVPALHIGALLEMHRPRFVMLDVEGAEAALFQRPLPKFVRFVVLELHPKKYPNTTVKQIVDCMSASGLTYDPVSSRGRTLGFMRV